MNDNGAAARYAGKGAPAHLAQSGENACPNCGSFDVVEVGQVGHAADYVCTECDEFWWDEVD